MDARVDDGFAEVARKIGNGRLEKVLSRASLATSKPKSTTRSLPESILIFAPPSSNCGPTPRHFSSRPTRSTALIYWTCLGERSKACPRLGEQ